MSATPPASGLPLAGVRVLDLSAVISGPFATACLADQGAEIVKIEPFGGDTSRRIGPAKGDMSAVFIACNRHKKSVAVDLKHPGGRDVVLDLARRADVVFENQRPGVMDRLGLGYAALSALNPRLVYVSISGFGPDGPRAADRAYDSVIQGVSGVCASQRDPVTGDPSLLSASVCDKLTSLTAAQATCAALFARERSGRGEHVKVAMLDASVAFQWPDAMFNHVFLDDPPPPSAEIGASARPWKTLDGFVTTNAPQPEEFEALCRAFGRPELARDPRFSTLAGRFQNGGALRAELEPVAATMDTATLLARLRAHGAPAGRVNERAEVAADEQVIHNRLLRSVDHGPLGRVRLPRGAARFGDADCPPAPAPFLGEHTREVLRALGYDEARIDELARAGAIREAGPAA